MQSDAPRILMIIRAGAESIHRSWIWTAAGLLDIALSAYDDTDFSGDGVQYLHRFRGGKFPGIKDFFESHPGLLEKYDFFWVFEDDLVLPLESLLVVRRLLDRFQFQLSALALSYYSFFTWPLAVRNARFQFRGTDFVEVMAPIMSRAFLQAAMPAFADNYSAWGHEWLWRKLLHERQEFAAVLDAAPVVHGRPFDRSSLVRNRPQGIRDPKEDLEEMIAKYGLDRETPFRNLFGVTGDSPPHLLSGDRFLQEALRGYEEMLALHYESFTRCIDMLVRGARPVASLETLRQMPRFRMIETTVANRAGQADPLC